MNIKNNQEELLTTIENILSSLSGEYIIDLYQPNYKVLLWQDLSNKSKYIQNTITIYKKHHEDFDSQKIKPIFEVLLKIIKDDEVIEFENILIYKELYKILGLIDATFEAQKLLNNPKEYPSGFAKIQSDKKQIKTYRKFYKQSIVGPYRVSNRKEARLKYWVSTLYLNNKNLVNFYLHGFLVGDLAKMKSLHEDTEVNNLFLSNLDYFLMQKTTIGAVIKSLGILLYSELTYYMKMNKNDSEVYMKAIIHELFNEPVNVYEFDKHITIKSSLGFLPIFAASKKSNLANEDENFIKNKLFEEVQEFNLIDQETFDISYNSYIKNPHIQYLLKYPVELFRENPKYSS